MPRDNNAYALLPTSSSDTSLPSSPPSYRKWTPSRLSWIRRRHILILIAFLVPILIFHNLHNLVTMWRDFGYLIRPLWDKPEKPFNIIDHYPPSSHNTSDPAVRDAWCRMHKWTPRPVGHKPVVVDAIMLFTEVDMLEIRIREYLPFVDIFVIAEADRTHSGEPKSLSFPEVENRLVGLVEAGGKRLVYYVIKTLEPDLEKGDFKNEHDSRVELGRVLTRLRDEGSIPVGSLLVSTDLDEIISRDTLELLTSCEGYGEYLQLQVWNYRYSYLFPLPDHGWAPPNVHTVTETSGWLPAMRRRMSDDLLAGAGWHCSFCYPTLQGMREKMLGYGHNDRVRDAGLLEEEQLRDKVCKGEDPFGMWPEAFTFHDIIAQSGPIDPHHSFLDLPVALREEPERFGYLLADGCNRPDH